MRGQGLQQQGCKEVSETETLSYCTQPPISPVPDNSTIHVVGTKYMLGLGHRAEWELSPIVMSPRCVWKRQAPKKTQVQVQQYLIHAFVYSGY